jgi:hypothetical protein
MNDIRRNDIRLTLTTSDCRTGVCWLGQGDNIPMTWDHEGDGETTSADFAFFDINGDEIDSHNIDGDDWRWLDAHSNVSRVLYWRRRGIDLEEAINAEIEERDPEGVDGDLHGDIDELVDVLRRTTAALQTLTRVPGLDQGEAEDQVADALTVAESLLECYKGRK